MPLVKEYKPKPAAEAKPPTIKPSKKPTFSYTRIEKYDQCGMRYKLTYVDRHFVDEPGIAAAFGTLVHYMEETIANKIIKGEPIDYTELRRTFEELNIPESEPQYDEHGSKKKGTEGGIYGTKELARRYKDDFFRMDSNGTSYFLKAQAYANDGIMRLERRMQAHPNLEIIAVELEFYLEFGGYTFHGYIDRLLYDHDTNEYVIEDIKTKGKPFPDKELITPLQFVIYSMAVKYKYGLYDYPTRFNYDLPICDLVQQAGTKGAVKRGMAKVEKLLAGIANGNFVPKPSPLCYWCEFCGKNPHQPEGGRGKCPYYSLWTPDQKSFAKLNEWEGPEKHEAIMEKYQAELGSPTTTIEVAKDFDFFEFLPNEKTATSKKDDDDGYGF